uniref:COMM domain-containing protein 5 n=1 Tax=Palpitomonas bilix TaxID=652834 RepID=A0A7S3CZ28_9EUKA|mmetsp:Transcript_1541/g.3110  ORF Transcript_1541/g.3110 Transcript_1541/m.3110 type:complete len:239 (+) Transcript_1541:178-894(+)|eukprot:CAMPEP_0113902404 /NCGR_PEP_ID=MMETSP0780_2-20120614/21826_1 /TAXON_ID=652834 /ORGANISM="Palpitomonas bilix" /LENGTH=238 /DNA_ID=CAMNT_0000895195 /DNA_START=196 /DNA_END=912 /DNA_ORIENTATION=+ /assembly_acc=CAM_ASM_000599
MSTPRSRTASKFGALRGGASDHLDTYFGVIVPKEVKETASSLGEVSQSAIRKLLQLGLSYLKTGDIDGDVASKLKEDEGNMKLLLGLTTCLREAIKHRVASNIVERDLITLKFPPAAAADIGKVVDASRDECEDVAREEVSVTPHLENVRWRVDVAISTSSSHRALKPSITMELSLTDGSVKTFEMSIEEFHELRYNVAKLLKEFHDMEKSQLFKITEAWEKALQQQAMKKAAASPKA